MPDKTIRTEQEVEDMLRGLVLLGTGGGGHPKVGRQYLLSHIEAGQEIRWKDLSNVPDDAWACCVFGMGSVAPHDPLSEAERNRLAYPMVEAVQELERYTGVSVQALVSFEPGAVATSGTLDVATRLGLDVMDADNCGRAVPKLTQTLAAMAGHTLWPAAIVDTWGKDDQYRVQTSGRLCHLRPRRFSDAGRSAEARLACRHAYSSLDNRSGHS